MEASAVKGGCAQTMADDRPDFLTLDVTSMEIFRRSHPEITSSIQELLWLEWVLFSLVIHSNERFTSSTSICLREIHAYHHESVLFCMRGLANLALGLTRMACELSRDVLRFARDSEAEKIWWSRRTDKNKYKTIFKFSADSPVEQALLNIYRISSEHGVHGHIFFCDMDSANTVSLKGEQYIKLLPDEGQIMNALFLNLRALQYFIIAFLGAHGRVFFDSEDIALVKGAKQLRRSIFAFAEAFRSLVRPH
jgi:hypothetical protein